MEDTRDAFEAWAGIGHLLNRDLCWPDQYEAPRTQAAWEAWQAATAQCVPEGWRPIGTAPRGTKRMFVVIGINVLAGRYKTDPYCVWRDAEEGFARWPHHFPPTHWLPLPPVPKPGEQA